MNVTRYISFRYVLGHRILKHALGKKSLDQYMIHRYIADTLQTHFQTAHQLVISAV